MSALAYVFPGQGSQTVGMGRALCAAFPEAKAVFDEADAALGESISSLCFDGPEDALKLTRNTQPAILTMSVAAHAVFKKRVPAPPAFFAGHSLGEYSALVAAGALKLSDGVKAVRARGTFMQDAVPAGVGAMAAVLGLPAADVAAVCAEVSGAEVVAPANYNEPNQTVIAGHAGAVARAGEALKAKGAKRVLPLPVSAPFHCTLMQPVVARLQETLKDMVVSPLAAPVVSNVEALPNSDVARVKELLLRQVTAPVRWVETVQGLEKAGVTRAIELGPGKVLCGLIKRIAPGVSFANVEDDASLTAALKFLEGA